MHRTEAMDGRSPESRSWGPNPLTGFLGAALRQDFRPPPDHYRSFRVAGVFPSLSKYLISAVFEYSCLSNCHR